MKTNLYDLLINLIYIYIEYIYLYTIIIMKYAYAITLEDLTIQLKHVVILDMMTPFLT